ncbi:MAG TPA: thiamine diphosphokinase, partial [Devosiaceae bacterium]|nr:thiamine diphosphokinase [Devosiaceae bacterium]
LTGRGFALVAADGAADDLALAGLTPELIVGDFDSIDDAAVFAGRARMVRLDEQDTTDFEKCIYATEAPLYVGLGLTGRRFDHTLAAIHVVTRFAGQRKILLVDEHDVALAVSGPFALSIEPGERVSVYPLGQVRFARSRGLKYPLDGLEMAPGIRTGTSNVATVGAFSIEPAAGETAPWLLIVERLHLTALIDALLG